MLQWILSRFDLLYLQKCEVSHDRHLVHDSLAYPTLVRLRESAEKRVWQQRRGLAAAHCHHSILCGRSHEAPAANQINYRDATLNIVLPDLTFQSESCVNIIKS